MSTFETIEKTELLKKTNRVKLENTDDILIPVTREHISGRKLMIGCPTLIDGLNVEESEHAPVGQTDDTPDPGSRPRPVSAIHLNVLH